MRAASGRPALLFSRETAEAMLQPQLADSGAGYRPALGFFLRGDGDARFFYHPGWNEGFVAHAQFFPATGQGHVVMLNSNEGNDLMFDVGRALHREFGWPGDLPAERTPVEVDAPERFAGEYATGGRDWSQGQRPERESALQAGTQPPLPMCAGAPLEYFSRALNTTLAFRQDEAGAITGLALQQEGQTFEAERSTHP